MPRTARELYPNRNYHIIARGNNHKSIFYSDDDFKRFLSLMNEYIVQNEIKIFHYVLMNTHIHLVIKLPDLIDRVSEAMKMAFWKYTVYHNKKYNYEGRLWKERFSSQIIENEKYLLSCGLYIEYNPVRAGVVSLPEEYKWSSYRHWINKYNDKVLSEHPMDIKKNYYELSKDYKDVYLNEFISKKKIGRPKKQSVELQTEL